MYTVQAGRVVCKNNIPLFNVAREVNTETGASILAPTQADAMAHYITKKLNEKPEEWQEFYKSYMTK